jgi:hypothetical protein
MQIIHNYCGIYVEMGWRKKGDTCRYVSICVDMCRYMSICVDTCRYAPVLTMHEICYRNYKIKWDCDLVLLSVRALEKSSYSIGMLGYKTYISKNNGEGTRSAHDAKASTFFTSIGLIMQRPGTPTLWKWFRKACMCSWLITEHKTSIPKTRWDHERTR